MKNVYIQVYSVRNEAQKDFVGSLKRIAEIGYAGVEFAGHGGLSASEMKKVLTDLNLDPISSHIRVDEAEEDRDALRELALACMNDAIDELIAMREKEGGQFKISVRTGNHADASAVCKELGGGGHIRAAGCTLEGPLDSAVEQMLATIKRTVDRIV